MDIRKIKMYGKIMLCVSLYMFLALKYHLNHVFIDWETDEKLSIYGNVCFVGADVFIVLKAIKKPFKIYDDDSFSEYCKSSVGCPSWKNRGNIYIVYDVVEIFLLVDKKGVIEDKSMRGS